MRTGRLRSLPWARHIQQRQLQGTGSTGTGEGRGGGEWAAQRAGLQRVSAALEGDDEGTGERDLANDEVTQENVRRVEGGQLARWGFDKCG